MYGQAIGWVKIVGPKSNVDWQDRKVVARRVGRTTLALGTLRPLTGRSRGAYLALQPTCRPSLDPVLHCALTLLPTTFHHFNFLLHCIESKIGIRILFHVFKTC